MWYGMTWYGNGDKSIGSIPNLLSDGSATTEDAFPEGMKIPITIRWHHQ